MRVTGQRYITLPLRKLRHRLAQGADPRRKVVGRVEQVEAQCGQHLVVAGPAEMQPSARVADSVGEPALERRVDVFVLECNVPVSGVERRLELLQAITDGTRVFVADEPGGGEHLRMRDRPADVVGHEASVQQMILAGRVTQDPFAERQALVPEARHEPPPACSAGVNAAMSLTTSVPVPSLVNTSSKRLSGKL